VVWQGTKNQTLINESTLIPFGVLWIIGQSVFGC